MLQCIRRISYHPIFEYMQVSYFVCILRVLVAGSMNISFRHFGVWEYQNQLHNVLSHPFEVTADDLSEC